MTPAHWRWIVLFGLPLFAGAIHAADLPWQVRQKWNDDTIVNVYNASGVHDPKWDATARLVLEAAERNWGESAVQNGDEDRVMIVSGDAALRAGCRDPMVIYAHARSMAFYARKPADILKSEEGMVEGFRSGPYPAIRKCFGLGVAAETLVHAKPNDPDARKTATALCDEIVTLLPEVFADPRLPTDEAAQVLEVLGRVSQTVEADRHKLQDQAVAILEKSVQPQSVILTAKGEAAIADGWRARGSGFANTITPEGAKTLDDKNALGKQLLLQAWALNPKDYETARAMLAVQLNDGSRPEMEKWFKAATEIDPEDYRAYHDKLNWLEPKWYGSAEQMLAFGRECAALPQSTGRVQLILIDAHCALSRYTSKGYPSAPQRDYFKSDPKIFEEIKPVYEKYLAAHPSNYHKTRYAVIAAYSGQWKLATQTFRTMAWQDRSTAVLYDAKALDDLVKESVAEYRKQWDNRVNQDFPTNKVVAARWGGGQKWADVTEDVQFWVDDGGEVWADMEALKVDPTPGWKKHLEIMYTDKGKTKTISVNEGSKIPVAELR